MAKQTTIQKTPAIRKGSVRVLIGDSSASLVDIGALRNPVFTSLAEVQSIEFDNVDSLSKFVKGQKVQVTFDLAEINFDTIAKLDAGLVTLTTVAGSATPVTNEAKGTGWTVGTPFRLNNKNGANTVVTAIVIKENAVTLVLNTDYRVFVGNGTNGELGYTFIVPLTARTLAITADYSYTPNASKKLTFVDSGTKTLKYIRLTNTDENGKVFQINIDQGTNFAPLSVDFAGDEEDNVAILPVDFQGNIVDWTDEQQTT